MVKYKRGHLHYPIIPIHKVLENTVERFPDKLAFLYPKKLTFKQFQEQVDIFATVLKNLGYPQKIINKTKEVLCKM